MKLPHYLTNFETQRCYYWLNGVYQRDHLPAIARTIRIADDATYIYILNIDKYDDTGTHWVTVYVKSYDATCLVLLVFNILLKKF